MCGIAGLIDKASPDIENDIIKMREAVSHRGPDGKGIWISTEDGVALGHRRLSILDLSEKGAQPMTDGSDRYVIVHNGEVYNYIEIRKELSARGYIFFSGTDTEVILAAFDRWGKACVTRFNGMFAFAIWDCRKKSLFMARDRLGIKPLYYYADGKRLFFASEIKSILTQDRFLDSGLNTGLIDTYMSFGYVPGEETLLKGIKRLLPGHFMTWENGKLKIERYWDLVFDAESDLGQPFYEDRLRALVSDAVSLRMRSDVPVGVFLSGGLDSSIVTALLAKQLAEPVKTFSVFYDFGPQFNETSYAREVALHCGTEHHEFAMTPKDFMDFIPEYTRYMDEPVTESAAISLYYIARKAKSDVTVILSGEGADEVFGGYDFYAYNLFIEKLRPWLRLPGARKALEKMARGFPYAKGRKYAGLALLSLEDRYRGISTYEERMKSRLYTSELVSFLKTGVNVKSETFIQGLFSRVSGADPLSRMLYFDTKTWLVDDLLIKADRMTMAPALELRVPFLDHRIVEFAAAMPSRYKIRGRAHKYILKEMMKDGLPQKILNRKKLGFPTPLKRMFRDSLFHYAEDVLLSKYAGIHEFFSEPGIRELLHNHKAGIEDNHRVIWQLIVLENWLKINAAHSVA